MSFFFPSRIRHTSCALVTGVPYVCSSDLNSARSFLLAVIVPDKKVVETRLGANPDESELRALIREEMRATAAQAGLRAVEVPREFIIENEPFSTGNGLLTSVMKRKRPALNARYGERLEALYEAIAERQKDRKSTRLNSSH